MAAISDDEGSRPGSDVESGDDLPPSNGNEVFDSSEEEDEDDEDQLREEGKGWIVDEDEDEDEEITKKKRKKKHRKRKAEREEREKQEDLLDEDDLDLLMENSGAKRPASSSGSSKSKFKRLKRATASVEEEEEEDETPVKSVKPSSRLEDFFSDEEEDQELATESAIVSTSHRSSAKSAQRSAMDELDDFIEDDEFSDMDDAQKEEARERRNQERLQPTEISGIDPDRVNELYDIFGDGEDYAWALEGEEDEATGGAEGDEGRPQLRDIYEPEELKARMLTEGDKIIRDTDVPERFQEYRKNIRHYEITPEEFEHEKQWIAYMLCVEKSLEYTPGSDFANAVSNVLTFIVKQNLEVPYIYSHRRDYLLKTTITGEGDNAETQVETLLTENDLWRIVYLDIDFHSLSEKRKRVIDLQQALKVEDEALNSFIDNANNVTHFQDINDYINFVYSDELKDIGRKQSKATVYDKIRNNSLYDLVRAIGIKASDFALNVESTAKLYSPVDSERSPLDLATELCSDEYSLYVRPSQAIEVTKHFFAEQLYIDMRMRRYLRNIAYESTLSVELTTQGKLKIDKNSPFADLKYSINRDYLSLKAQPDFFLRMLKAEALGLITIKFSYTHDDLLNILAPYISSDGQSELAAEWNKFRVDSLSYAIKKLFPLVQLNLKEELRRDCETLLFTEVRSAFVRKLDQAPYHVEGKPNGSIPRVFAITPGNGKFGQDAIIASLLDSNGKLIETYKFIENPIRKSYGAGETTFSEHFLEVVSAVEPDVIAINGFNAQTKKLFDIIQEIIENNDLKVLPRDEDGDIIEESRDIAARLTCIFVNDEVASRYQHSQRAAEEFPDKSILARYTIALGRYVQSPLLEYLNLKDDVSSLSIHAHQSLLPEDKLHDAIVTSFVDIVNMVGVDINQCVSNSYLATALPFVAGLGDRKASGLLKAVQQHPLFSRQALITNPSIRIGSIVFVNCSSFLRIPQHKSVALRANDDLEAVTPLDDTRIHPEDYSLAEKMAGDALELDEEEMEELKNSESGETVIDRLFAQPNYEKALNSLILEEYSRQLEQEYRQKKRATLQLILEELQDPFMDIRQSFRLLTSEETFQSLTGENETTFFNGAVVPVKVKGVGKYNVYGYTSSQIEVETEEGKAKERNDTRDLSMVYHFGQSVSAKILHIDYDTFKAKVSLLKDDVSDPVHFLAFDRSHNWDTAREEAELEAERVSELQTKQHNRTIDHPQFRNMNARDAEAYVSHRDDGYAIIRPSSKGPDHLAITWKVSENLYQHVDVIEKEDNQYGKYYVIGTESFGDIDEIFFSYIQEISKRIREMTHHEKFQAMTREEAISFLENFSKSSKKASYVFAWNHKRPGWFLLLFKLKESTPVQTWNVKAEPKGFMLNHYLYSDMKALCNGFKTLMMNRVNNRGQSQGRSAAAAAGGPPPSQQGQGQYSGYNQGYAPQQGYDQRY